MARASFSVIKYLSSLSSSLWLRYRTGLFTIIPLDRTALILTCTRNCFWKSRLVKTGHEHLAFLRASEDLSHSSVQHNGVWWCLEREASERGCQSYEAQKRSQLFLGVRPLGLLCSSLYQPHGECYPFPAEIHGFLLVISVGSVLALPPQQFWESSQNDTWSSHELVKITTSSKSTEQ